MISKCRDIMIEVGTLSYCLLTADRIKKSGHHFVTAEDKSLFNYAIASERPYSPVLAPFSNTSLYLSIVKTVLHAPSLIWGDAVSYGHNPLLMQHIQNNGLSTHNLRWTPWLLSKQREAASKHPSVVYDTVCTFVDKVHEIWEHNEITYSKHTLDHLKRILLMHLSVAERDIRRNILWINKWRNSPLFVGSGGRYENRLLSYLFTKNGNTVMRFDHGGERPLFLDKYWGINEFAFQNIFVTFGKGLESRLRLNVQSGKYFMPPDELQNTKFHSLVSNEFLGIYKKHYNHNVKKVRKVMVVLPLFSGDKILPGYYAPDFINVLVIWKAIQELKRKGFYLVLKKKPKLLKSRLFSIFDRFVDEINVDYFPDVTNIADAYVFFYLGTAFCQALMSLKPVVYVHLPYRVIDPWAKSELKRIICWIDPEEPDGVRIDYRKMINYLNTGHDMRAKRTEFVENIYLNE